MALIRNTTVSVVALRSCVAVVSSGRLDGGGRCLRAGERGGTVRSGVAGSWAASISAKYSNVCSGRKMELARSVEWPMAKR